VRFMHFAASVPISNELSAYFWIRKRAQALDEFRREIRQLFGTSPKIETAPREVCPNSE
jgi:hypothetical protein